MKKSIRSISLWIAIFSVAVLLLSQQTVEREYVQVLNIEMLVRVMKDGRPLAGLKKGDFTLLENGRKQEINGFLEMHRSITPREAAPTVETGKLKRPGRLFLLFFWIHEPSIKVDEVLDYFFKYIYREGDRVILADQRSSIEINAAAEKETRVNEFKAGVMATSRNVRLDKERVRLQIESYLQDYLDCLSMERKKGVSPRCDPNTVASQYEQLLREYRLQYQKPNVERLEAMTRALETIDADKWALVFFQHDTLPLLDIEKMKLGDNQYHLGAVLEKLEKVNRDQLFPMEVLHFAESLRIRFIQANTQFHLLFLDSRLSPSALEAASRFDVINPFPVFSNWEETFRQITEATGGEIMDGNRMQEALAEVANREDIYYMLTYAPSEGKSRKRKVQINVDRDGVTVIHGRRVEMENLPQIKLAAIVPFPGMVRLELENMYIIGQGEERSGLVRVSLSAAREDETPKILVKDVEIATTGSVKIPITGLEPGRYKLGVKVVDSFTGMQAQGESPLDILGGEMSAETVALLKLAADYAERLRHAAFRFICRETVTEECCCGPRSEWFQ